MIDGSRLENDFRNVPVAELIYPAFVAADRDEIYRAETTREVRTVIQWFAKPLRHACRVRGKAIEVNRPYPSAGTTPVDTTIPLIATMI